MEPVAPSQQVVNDGGAYVALGELNRQYLPIRVVPSHQRVDHVRELLGLFKDLSVDHPFKAVAAIFYSMTDWIHGHRAPQRFGDFQWYTRIDKLSDRLRQQMAWTEERIKASGRPSRTSTGLAGIVMEKVNELEDVGRMIVIIKACDDSAEDRVGHFHWLDSIITYQVPDEVRQLFVKAGAFEKSLRSIEGKIEGLKDPKSGQDGSQLFGQRPTENCTEVTYTVTEAAKTALDSFAAELRPHIGEHSVYIDKDHSMVYVFSNVVQVENMQKGCGGLFLIVNNAAFQDPELTWLHQAKRLSDKLANRIIHDWQIEQVEHHALNSAITQTAARNYAHHIGAHVKMRTTPQEIKKRISDLYGDVDWRKTCDAKPIAK